MLLWILLCLLCFALGTILRILHARQKSRALSALASELSQPDKWDGPLQNTVLQWLPEKQFKRLFEAKRVRLARQVECDSVGNYYYECFVESGLVTVDYPDYETED